MISRPWSRRGRSRRRGGRGGGGGGGGDMAGGARTDGVQLEQEPGPLLTE